MSYKVQDFSRLQTKLIDNAWSVFKDRAEKSRALKLETIATHSGKVINDRVYRGSSVKDAIKSFVKGDGAAYEKPFLLNHDREKDPIGRVKSAEYKQTASGKKWLNDHFEPSPEGSGFVKLTSVITDQDAIEKFLDGRYQTVSVGGSTDGAFCNICSKVQDKLHPMWASYKDEHGEECECRHIPGKTYGDSKAYVITGNLHYNEVSQVSVPADDAATHIAKNLCTHDALEDSLWKFFDAVTSVELLTTPARFGIVDANGNPLISLDTDTYKSTKTISIPSQTKIEAGSENGSKQPLSDEEFAEAHVLKHFADLGMLVLTDAQKAIVEKLQNAELTAEQSGIVKDTFIIHPSIPFNIYDKYHYEATMKLLDGEINLDKERYKQAIKDAAKTHSFFGDEQTMDIEAMKKALSDALAKVTSLEAELKARDTKITDQEKALTEATTKLKAIADAQHKAVVDEVIALRTELKLHDTLALADETKKVEALKAITDKYSTLPEAAIKIMLEDLKAQKAVLATKPSIADAPVENPLEKGTPAAIADAKPAEEPKTNDLKPYELF